MLIEPRALLASSVLGRHPLGGRHPVRPGCKVMGCPKGSNDGFKACRNWGFEIVLIINRLEYVPQNFILIARSFSPDNYLPSQIRITLKETLSLSYKETNYNDEAPLYTGVLRIQGSWRFRGSERWGYK